MTKQEKIQIVDDLYNELSSSACFFLTNAEGLNVSSINSLRKKCYEQGINYRIVKNSLIKKTLDRLSQNQDIFDRAECENFNKNTLVGSTGLFILNEICNKPAKLIKDFRKEYDIDLPLFKGAFIDGDFYIGEDQLDPLSKIKSKEELISEIIFLLESPIKNVLSSLNSGGNILSGLLKTLSTNLKNK